MAASEVLADLLLLAKLDEARNNGSMSMKSSTELRRRSVDGGDDSDLLDRQRLSGGAPVTSLDDSPRKRYIGGAPTRNFFPAHPALRALFFFSLVGVTWYCFLTLFVLFQLITAVPMPLVFIVTMTVAWNRVQGASPGAQLLFGVYAGAFVAVMLTVAFFLAKPTFNLYQDLDFAILGDVTSSSIKMTVRGGGAATGFRVAFGEAAAVGVLGATLNETLSLVLDTAAGDSLGFAELTGLEAGALYDYEVVFFDGNGDDLSGDDALTGSFRTISDAPGATVTFASSSCTQTNLQAGGVELSGYSRVAALDPDAMLFLGDFIYADVPWGFGLLPVGYGTNVALYEQDYRSTIRDEHVKSFLSSHPTYIMLDDHEVVNDYDGRNDTDLYVTATGVWKRYLGQTNPSAPVVAAGGGAQYTFALGDRSDFFVLDTRFHRDNELGIMIGDAQLTALLDWLADTQAARQSFKFIASSVGWSRNHPSPDANWNCRCPACEPLTSANAASCPDERQVVMDFIAANNITNVVLISGDSHKPGVFQIAPGVVEVSASPIFALSPEAWGSDEDATLFERGGTSTAFAFYEVRNDGLTVEIYAGGSSIGGMLGAITVYALNTLWFGAAACLGLLAWYRRTTLEKFAAPFDRPVVFVVVSMGLFALLIVVILNNTKAVIDEGFETPVFTLEVPLL